MSEGLSEGMREPLTRINPSIYGRFSYTEGGVRSKMKNTQK